MTKNATRVQNKEPTNQILFNLDSPPQNLPLMFEVFHFNPHIPIPIDLHAAHIFSHINLSARWPSNWPPPPPPPQTQHHATTNGNSRTALHHAMPLHGDPAAKLVATASRLIDIFTAAQALRAAVTAQDTPRGASRRCAARGAERRPRCRQVAAPPLQHQGARRARVAALTSLGSCSTRMPMWT
ncbi:hypothetical protein BFW01_g7588 [Lasiodiplodia theobromae]|nr:hypothetical protein BFW01_g7588 [Lasiodiplodia theobromae]